MLYFSQWLLQPLFSLVQCSVTLQMSKIIFNCLNEYFRILENSDIIDIFTPSKYDVIARTWSA